MRTFLISIILITVSLLSEAQNNFSVSDIDALTYKQYMQKDWKNLIKTGKRAKRKGIDFYYLQYRTGIAYYELKKYAEAVKYFEKIHSENPEDETILEYLYYSYLFSGRIEDARLTATYFSRKAKERLNIETEYPFIKALYFSTIQNVNDDYGHIPETDETVEQKTVLNESWYNISAEHYIGDRLTVFHGYSRLQMSNDIKDTNPDLPEEYLEDINQNEYYLSLKYHAGKGFNITGAFHYLNTLYYSPVYITIGRRTSLTYLYYFRENSVAGFLKFDKSFSIFNAAVESSVSDLNGKFQIQPALSLKIYPFANTKFYSETKGIYHIEDDNGTKRYSPVIKQTLGINFLKYSLLNISATYGDLLNYTEYNAFITNNDLDLTKLKAEIYLNFGLSKGRFNIFLNYQYNQKENTYLINDNEITEDYTNHIIAGGIKWYFSKY
ncbi:MAG: tetratricopeptide repeat protein [Chlorobi bacterium]|nr:tetratricopeptide repeat protein [Chlorobiota bacterium]